MKDVEKSTPPARVSISSNVAALLMISGGCGDSTAMTAAPGSTGGSGSFTIPGADLGDPTGGPSDEDCIASYPIAGAPFEVSDPMTQVVTPSVHCEALPADDAMPLATFFPVHVFRPQKVGGAWPDQQLPVVVFAPGGGGSVVAGGVNTFAHIIDPLVSEGAIIAAVEAHPGWNVAMRYKAMLCTLLWLKSSKPEAWVEAGNGRPNCDVVAMGHSMGGTAAFRVIERFPAFSMSPDIPTWHLRAAISVTPLSATGSPETASFPIASEISVPYLVLGGANDDDVGTGDSARAYDILAREEVPPLSEWDKVAVWSYGTPHCAWGGKLPGGCGATAAQLARAETVSSVYVPAFLRWQLLAKDVATNRGLFYTARRSCCE